MDARPASAARVPSSRTAAASSARSRSNDEIGMRYRYHRWHERLLLSPARSSGVRTDQGCSCPCKAGVRQPCRQAPALAEAQASTGTQSASSRVLGLWTSRSGARALRCAAVLRRRPSPTGAARDQAPGTHGRSRANSGQRRARPRSLTPPYGSLIVRSLSKPPVSPHNSWNPDQLTCSSKSVCRHFPAVTDLVCLPCRRSWVRIPSAA